MVEKVKSSPSISIASTVPIRDIFSSTLNSLVDVKVGELSFTFVTSMVITVEVNEAEPSGSVTNR